MIELVCSLHTSSHEDWEEQDTVMRIQLFSYVLSLCSQSNQNCKSVGLLVLLMTDKNDSWSFPTIILLK